MNARGPIAIDGTDIDAILDLAGAPKKKSTKRADDLEKTLGLELATETRRFLERPVELHHPDAEDPGVKDESFAGKLPDVGAWIEQLGKNREGLRQCVHHFLGLYPIGQELQYGDMMVAMIVLEPFSKNLSGVMYYDEREVGTWGGGSISAFLMQEANGMRCATRVGLEIVPSPRTPAPDPSARSRARRAPRAARARVRHAAPPRDRRGPRAPC